jgi:DNA-binding response OmpR family regulator
LSSPGRHSSFTGDDREEGGWAVAQTQTVLIVEHDRETRERIGRWFERAGFRLLACPGPTGEALTCVGGEGGPCPLVDASDLVVLDLWLQSDSLMEGTSSLELLMFYITTGKPIVAISHGPDASHLFVEERLAVLEWPPEQAELVETARAMLSTSVGQISGSNGP